MDRIPAPEPGLHYDVPFETYLAWDAVDCSLLKKMDHSSEYARYCMTQPDPDKEAYAKGRLFHLLCGDPGKADDEFIVKPSVYVNDDGEEKPWHGGAKVCKQWALDQAASNRTVIASDAMDDCLGMAARVRTHPKLGPLLVGAKVEVSVVWIVAATGVVCKGRFDLYHNGIVVDLKSTSGSAKPERWFHEAYRYLYHLQCAMYLDAVKALGLTSEVPWFVFAAVEGYAPYSVAVYDVQDDIDALSYDFLHLGRVRYRALLQHYAWCLEHDEWPGYGDEHMDMELPYAGRKELEELTQFEAK